MDKMRGYKEAFIINKAMRGGNINLSPNENDDIYKKMKEMEEEIRWDRQYRSLLKKRKEAYSIEEESIDIENLEGSKKIGLYWDMDPLKIMEIEALGGKISTLEALYIEFIGYDIQWVFKIHDSKYANIITRKTENNAFIINTFMIIYWQFMDFKAFWWQFEDENIGTLMKSMGGIDRFYWGGIKMIDLKALFVII